MKDTKGNMKITSPNVMPLSPTTHTMTLLKRIHYKELQVSSSGPSKKQILCLGTFFEYMSGNANVPQFLVSFEK